MRAAGPVSCLYAVVYFAALAAPLLAGCAQPRSYASFARFCEPSRGDAPDALAGCQRAYAAPSRLEIRCPGAEITVDDRLREAPYSALRRWPDEELTRQSAGLTASDGGTMRISVEDTTLADGTAWPALHAVLLTSRDDPTPLEDVLMVRAPFGRDGVRELRCTATGPLGVERCQAAVPQLLRETPAAALPAPDELLHDCAEAPLHVPTVRGATRTLCRDLRLVKSEGGSQWPKPEKLAVAFDMPTGSVTAEVGSLPDFDEDGRIEVRAFTLLQQGRVVWAGVQGREPSSRRFVHCGMQLPPALAQRHCYRAVVIELTGDDQLPER